jgi:hypothetical protein
MLAWLLLRRQTYGHYQDQASASKKKTGRLPETTTPDIIGLMPALKEDTPVNSQPFEPLPETGDVGQNTSDKKETGKPLPASRRKITGAYAFALLLSLALFYFHVMVIIDVLGDMLHYKAWLMEHLGPKHTGKLLLLGCFFALMTAHVIEAAVWGLFLRWAQIVSSITEGVYFSAASITTLGYGDILLKYPWRHLGTLTAISGVLMFGCSTAFLFLVLQKVWQHF